MVGSGAGSIAPMVASSLPSSLGFVRLKLMSALERDTSAQFKTAFRLLGCEMRL